MALTPTEMRLLLEFSAAPGTVLSRDRLLERVWDYGWGGDTRVVDVHVQRLRTKIGQDRIETVRGFGYKLTRHRERLALRTGVRWKISIAIAAVGALIAVALSLVVHNAARVSMLDNAREVQLERLLFAQRLYEASSARPPQVRRQAQRPALPAELREKARRRTGAPRYVEEYAARRSPDVWAAVPLANGDVLSLHTRFADRSARSWSDLDRALVIGSVSVVFGGCALGVLIGGQLSRRLRKAARRGRPGRPGRHRGTGTGRHRRRRAGRDRRPGARRRRAGRRAAASGSRPSAGSPRTSRTSCAPR